MKIAIDRVLVEQALEALEADNSKLWPSDRRTAAYFNLRAALAEPVEEPVAWFHTDFGSLELSRVQRVGWKPLYAAPPQRKPLPASDIVTMYDERPMGDSDMIEFARAVERAHEIR